MTTARQSAALAFDSAGNAVLSLATRDSTGTDAVLDSGSTSLSDSEHTEAIASLKREGFLVTAAQYAADLVSHAASDSLIELSDTQPGLFVNPNTIRGGFINKNIGPTISVNANQVRTPTVTRAA
jgi:hypothetical protein